MKVVVTGASAGLGFLTTQKLLNDGHEVIPHVRNSATAAALASALPGVSRILVADLRRQDEVVQLSDAIRGERRVDAVIHNAGLGDRLPTHTTTEGRTDLFAVNVVAPYIITARNPQIDRWIFVSSALHREAHVRLDASWHSRAWVPRAAYAESKLLLTVMCQATAQLRPLTESNSVEPGWVPTRMGGPHAPDDLRDGVETQVWLATADAEPTRNGGHYFHLTQALLSPAATDRLVQNDLITYLQDLTGVGFRIAENTPRNAR